MGALTPKKSLYMLGLPAFVVLAGGCADTGFGQPCRLPETPSIRQACEPSGNDNEDDPIQRESKASCAIRNFAGCETRTCLVYRDSNPFCSEPCTSDGDCESDLCAPLVGDRPATEADLQAECERTLNCFCIRKGDLDN